MDAEAELVAAADPWALALPVLAGPHVKAVPEMLALVADLRGVGARLFEVVVGTPIEAYGARLTFRTGIRVAADVAARAGLADHPWGVPDWVGLRTGADGVVHAKAYHRLPPLDATLLHRGLPESARPVMAAQMGPSVEVYAVLPGPMSWLRHATDALEPLGCAPVDPGMSMVARPNGWAVSVRHDGEELTAVTLFATSDSLPADPSVEEQWVIGMSVDERRLHSLRVAAAATVSRTPGRRYRMLAWNYTRSGLFSRAVSLHSGDVLVDR